MLKGARLIHDLVTIKLAPGNYSTDFIAEFIGHFNGRSLDDIKEAWAATSTGQRYLAGESITDHLHEYKNAKPNVFARQYLDFMEKYYFEKLSDQLNLEDSIRFKERDSLGKAFGKFMVDAHDFTHVLTGYPPDPFGELARIEYGKNFEGRGWRILSVVGKARILSNGLKEWFSCRPVYREARLMRKFAKNYIFEDWFTLIGQDINEVRKNLDTPESTLYNWKRA